MDATGRDRRLRRGFDDAAIGMAFLTPELVIERVNDAFCALIGRDEAQLEGVSILNFTHPDDVRRSVTWSAEQSTGERSTLIKRYLRPDGATIEAAVTTVFVDAQDGERYFFSQLQDVTEQRRAERQRAAVADLGRRALECTDVVALMEEATRSVRGILASGCGMVCRRMAGGEVRVVAADGEVPAVTIPAGLPSQTAYTLDADGPVLSNDLAAERRFAVPEAVVKLGLRRGVSVPVPERSGARYVLLVQADDSGRGFSGDDVRFLEAVAHVLAGAIDRAAFEEELRRRALEDPLTGLANRALMLDRLAAELRHAQRVDHHVCVLAVDLDRFRTVNDTLGHELGDTLLRHVAARLTAHVREEDLVSRNGDQFAVLCTRTATDQAIAEVAGRLVAMLAEPFTIDGREVFITASVGVAVSVQAEETAEELLRDADAAMHQARELGGSRFEVFDAALRHRLVERMAIESDLRHAVARDQLEMHYQPLVALSDERLVGFEALLRWHHPERGTVSPGQFVPIAEETGLIVPIGSWVLQAVCAQLARWPDEVEVAANLSARQLTPRLVDEVRELLCAHRIAPERLVLEITESLVLDPSARPVITALRELGVQLALDDFGTGYSSLGSLQRVPLDAVKLDRSLTSELSDGQGTAIARAAIELGAALDVVVIAEGIETRSQLEALRALGCPLGQGFLFAKPMCATDAGAVLAARAAGGIAA